MTDQFNTRIIKETNHFTLYEPTSRYNDDVNMRISLGWFATFEKAEANAKELDLKAYVITETTTRVIEKDSIKVFK